MALTETAINQLKSYKEDMEINLDWGNASGKGLYSAWYSFQWVANRLGVWADDTTIGAETKQNLIQLTNSLYSFMETTKKLCTSLDNYIENQKNINNSNI